MESYLQYFLKNKLLYLFRKFGMILKLDQQRVKQCTACWLKPTSTDGQVTCQSNAVQQAQQNECVKCLTHWADE